MKCKVIEGFDKKTIISDLKKRGKIAHKFITIVEFLFSECIVDLMNELNNAFTSDRGNKPYDRLLILGIFLYGFSTGARSLTKITHLCQESTTLKIFTRDHELCYTTLKRFLEDSDRLILKKVFLYTLVKLNDLDFLNFLHGFVDGTDAIIHGSKYYTITIHELEALKLMKEWNLLHNQREKSIMRVKNELATKYLKYENDEEMLKLIKIIIKRLSIYNYKMAARIDEFEKALNETEKDFISITFPSATLMPTKKGNFDFAFNLQEVITDNDIIISGLLIKDPNDNIALDQVIVELKENFEILREMIEKYGHRRNYKEIEQMLKKAIFVLDSGYFSDFNLESAYEHDINALIMSKVLARQINKEYRINKGLKKPDPDVDELESIGRKQLLRVNNGYLCPIGEKLELTDVKEINSEFNREEGLSGPFKEKSFLHTSTACSTCELKDKCKFTNGVVDRVSTQSYEMTNKLTNERYLSIYKERFHSSESINGYLKGKESVLLLIGSNEHTINNELQLINTLYNLTRTKNLKGTLY